jgi:ABC-type glycerol-3-phosphate transport system permease component
VNALAFPHREIRRRWSGGMSAVNALLLSVAALAIYPYLVMLFGGLKSSGELTTNPGGVPAHPTAHNFTELFSGETGSLMWRALLNSFIVTIPFTALTVLLCAMAGYAFAKYSFRGRSVLFALLIASMLVPTEVNIPTLYVFFSRIGWLNSYQVQILPGTASVLGMFMARQYMRDIPDEVLEAASVDGAGHWRRFWHFVVPMSLPILGAIAILTFVFKWSDYLWPLVMVTDPNYQPIMVALPSLSTTQSGFIIRYELLLAGCVIITLPLLLLFLRFQDTLMRGTTAGAVRG